MLFLRNPSANMRMYNVSGDNHFQNSANLELVFCMSSKPNEKTEMARNLDRISSQVKSLVVLIGGGPTGCNTSTWSQQVAG